MTWHPIGPPPPSGAAAVLVQVAGREVALFQDERGQRHALPNSCPHKGGPLVDGIVQAGHVTCPWHGWRFELATGKCTTVAEDSIVPCRVREVAGNLEVDLP